MPRFCLPTSLPSILPPHVLLHSNHHRLPECTLPALFPPATTRPFRSGRRLLDDGAAPAASQTHYEALNVPHTASMAEIKKSFYKLSKAHHPDHNPKDPHASRRFMRISEAYAVLGHSEKRAVYDRNVIRHHIQSRHSVGHANSHRPNSSYHSTGPAGGRPASGLSRRRSTFRGPPPSFYRNTGSGGTTKANGSFSGSSGSSGSSSSSSSSSRPGFGTGAGPGNVNPDDHGSRSHPNTPHFDRASAERTQRRLDERSAHRRAAAEAEKEIAFGADSSMMFGFFGICIVLTAGVVVPVLVLGEWRRNRKEPAKLKER